MEAGERYWPGRFTLVPVDWYGHFSGGWRTTQWWLVVVGGLVIGGSGREWALVVLVRRMGGYKRVPRRWVLTHTCKVISSTSVPSMVFIISSTGPSSQNM